MKKLIKTNAARILDQNRIEYELISYEVDENDLSAENVAAKCNMPVEQSVKTLVLRGDKTGIIVACIPGDAAVDLKKLADVSHNKKVEMVPMKEILSLTGYIRGGVSPLGMKKEYPIYMEEIVLLYDEIILSAGQRGLQLKLDPKLLLQVLPIQIADIANAKA